MAPPSPDQPETDARAWQALDLPAAVRTHPAMLTLEERQYLAWLTAYRFAGRGAVVDLGCWLGGSSIALAEGLRRAGRRERVQCFDRFVWEPEYMASLVDLSLAPGDDFRPEFARLTASHGDHVVPRKADLLGFRWEEGPIEILFVDAAKSWALLNGILAGFGDALLPGCTRVILQDYRFDGTWWLPPAFASRPDLWRETEAVEHGTTVTFVLQRPLRDAGGSMPRYDDGSFTYAQAEGWLRERIARESPANSARLERGLAWWALLYGDDRDAARARERAEAAAARTGSPPIESWDRAAATHLAGLCTRLLQARDWVRAAAAAERVLAHDDTVVDGWLVKVAVAFERRDVASARAALDRAEAIAPAQIGTVLWRCALSLHARQPRGCADAALAVLRRATLGTAEVDWAGDLLVEAWSQSGADLEAGALTMADLVTRHPGSAGLHANLAHIALALGRTELARRHVARALAIDPHHAHAARVGQLVGAGLADRSVGA